MAERRFKNDAGDILVNNGTLGGAKVGDSKGGSTNLFDTNVPPPIVPKPVAPPLAISPQSITEPVAPITVTPQPPTTGAVGMLGEMQEGSDQFTANLERDREAKDSDRKTALDAYLGSLASPGEAELTADLYNDKGGVDDTQAELNEINDQIRKEQRGLDLQLREIEKNTQGLFGGALEDAKQNAIDKSLQRQADLSIIQMGIQGRYDSAKAIADRAIAVRLERDLAKQTALKTIYEDNKDLFTLAEQREFETKQADRERLLKRKEDNLTMISDLSINALQNGAPTDLVTKMRGAETVEEAIAIGGTFIDRYDRRTKEIQLAIEQEKYNELKNKLENPDAIDAETREKIGKMDESKKAQTQITLVSNMLKLRALVEEHGTKNIIDPKARGEIASLRSQLQIDVAVAGGQGAISEPEAERYNSILGSEWALKSKVMSALDTAISTNNRKIRQNIDFVEATFPGAVSFEPFSEFLDNQELDEYLKNNIPDDTPTDESAIASWISTYLPSLSK